MLIVVTEQKPAPGVTLFQAFKVTHGWTWVDVHQESIVYVFPSEEEFRGEFPEAPQFGSNSALPNWVSWAKKS